MSASDSGSSSSVLCRWSSLHPVLQGSVLSFLSVRDALRLSSVNQETNRIISGAANKSDCHSCTTAKEATAESGSDSEIESGWQAASKIVRRCWLETLLRALRLPPTHAAPDQQQHAARSEMLAHLGFWLRGPGWRDALHGQIVRGREYRLVSPLSLLPTNAALVISRETAACRAAPNAKLRPLQRREMKMIDTAYRAEMGACWDKLEGMVGGEMIANSVGAGYAALLPHTAAATTAALTAPITAPQDAEQEQEEESAVAEIDSSASSATIADAGNASPQAASSEQQRRQQELVTALSDYTTQELSCLLHAVQQAQTLQTAFYNERVQCAYGLHRSDRWGKYPRDDLSSDSYGERGCDDTASSASESHAASIVNASLDIARNPLFLLLPWPVAGEARLGDDRPPAPLAPCRLQEPVNEHQACFWDADYMQPDDWQLYYPDKPQPRPPPFYPPIPKSNEEAQDNLERILESLRTERGSNNSNQSTAAPLLDPNSQTILYHGGVFVADPPAASIGLISQLSSCLRGCPWPLQQMHSRGRLWPHRVNGECEAAARHLVERVLGVQRMTAVTIRTHMRWLGFGEGRFNAEADGGSGSDTTLITEAGTQEETASAAAAGATAPSIRGESWRSVFVPKRPPSHSSMAQQPFHAVLPPSLCAQLSSTLPGAFLIHFGTEHFEPFPALVAAPVAPGWVLAIMGGSSSFIEEIE